MAVIRVTCGAVGITYKDSNGQKRHALRDVKSGPFECDDKVAERFVHRRVAEYANVEANVRENIPEAEKEEPMQPDQKDGEKIYTREELGKMKNEDLKNLAGSLGIDVSGCLKKEEYVEAILEEQEDELPDLEAEDPVG